MRYFRPEVSNTAACRRRSVHICEDTKYMNKRKETKTGYNFYGRHEVLLKELVNMIKGIEI